VSAVGAAFHTLLGTATDVLPIVLFIFGFQTVVIGQRIPNVKRMVGGLVLTVLGLAMFLVGLEQALFPLGRLMAEQLTNPAFIMQADGEPSYLWVYLFAVAIGFSTTIAEPALLAVAMKASETSGGTIGVWGLRTAVATGVAFGVGLGAHRIVTGQTLHHFMIVGYAIVVLQTIRAPKIMIPLAYDSGGVTTSTVTVPLVTALGLGLAESVPGRSPLIDGFGLVAFASLFPIIAVLAYAQITFYWQARVARAMSDASGAEPETAKEES
jgi:hypothetical protein